MYMLGLNFSFVGKGNRVLIFSLFGYGILILWAVLSIRNDIIISIILIICTSLNVGLLSYSRNLYIESWGLQERILNNIKQNSDFEALSNGYHVVYLYNVKKTLEFGTPFIDEFWTSTYFMRFVTENKDIEAYVVSDPKDIKLKSEWTKDSINKEDVFIYDVGNNTLYKYYDE
jgi:c-di-AMP phosphodiesterase-like protein